MLRLATDSLKAIQMVYDLALSKLSHHHKPTNRDDINTVVGRMMHKDEIEADSGVELVNHLNAFATWDDENQELIITPESMYYVLKKVGFSEKAADEITAASIGLPLFNNLGDVRFCPFSGIQGKFSPHVAPDLMHPKDSGFYEKGTGRFDSQRFQFLKKCAVRADDGKMFISEEKYLECLKMLAADDTRWQDANIVQNLLGGIGNSGEIEALFKIIVSRWINEVPHAKLTDIKQFYINTATVFNRVISGELSLPPKPDDTSAQLKAIFAKMAPADISPKSSTNPRELDIIDRLLSYTTQYAAELTRSCPSYFNRSYSHTPPTISAGNLGLFHATCISSPMALAAPTPAPTLGR